MVKQVLSAIRAVAGNDDVKDAIVDAGATDLIVLAISHHLGNPQVPSRGLGIPSGMGMELSLDEDVCLQLSNV